MAKAIWKDAVIAESDDTVVVEGNHYFPRDAVNDDYLRPSSQETVCVWKGTANYFDVVVDDAVNEGAAWYYADPKQAAESVKGRVAFWRGVSVQP
ncbi:MAG: DUF427 domain-containing protein [Gemmatimonadota bacterium]|nr:DUF427 domain-containing protein [Gemmatimonadota bacterium]MDH3423608.1 DUF427 domain-containing protein [Gemmatimonadota bacterium]